MDLLEGNENHSGEESFRDSLLSFLKETPSVPVREEILLEKLKKGRKSLKLIRSAMDSLLKDGAILQVPGAGLALKERLPTVTKPFQAHPDGYGFVLVGDGQPDLFIPAGMTKGAMHQDTVEAVRTGTDRRGRQEGVILSVVDRARTSVVGTVHKFGANTIVRPRDAKLKADFILEPSEPPVQYSEGDLVVLEITSYPDSLNSPRGRILAQLGQAGDPKIDTEIVMASFGLSEVFPSDVVHEAERVAQETPIAPGDHREDFRDWDIVTIDGDNARDFDDALSLVRLKDGSFEVGIHIADVATYVREGTSLDKEAFRRGTSVYFPDRVVPMFPEVLSNGVLSLKPDEDRLARSVVLRLDPHTAEVLDSRITLSVIRSRMRMTYSKVHDVLRGANEDARYTPWTSLLSELWSVAQILRKKRFLGGSLDFDLPEPEIILDLRGHPIDIVRSPRYLSHQLIEEFMLLANQVVAKELVIRWGGGIFRVHEAPSIERISDLNLFLGALGLAMPIKEGEVPTSKTLSRVLEATRGTVQEKMVHFSVLRSLKQARYDVKPLGHFGLAMSDYTHFTSPIRRYPDLVVHRLLGADRSKPLKDSVKTDISKAASHSSERERAAVDAERMSIDFKRIRFLGDHVGEVFSGVISGVAGFGFFVELDDTPVEGMVPVSSLSDDYYVFQEKHHSLRGERTRKVYRIGDPVSVRIMRVDLERLKCELALEGMEESAGRRRKKTEPTLAAGLVATKPKTESPDGKKSRRGRKGRRRKKV
ncbi:ribonuclease R [Leptospirillum ferrooxidans]|uniref:ribonuclease R n=1 Tax=Leptospirillum ferrooxidans TaxID=180 RepID=UPI001E3D777C|nr:ribonuclease R [Leptospirillum ferrooxidans]